MVAGWLLLHGDIICFFGDVDDKWGLQLCCRQLWFILRDIAAWLTRQPQLETASHCSSIFQLFLGHMEIISSQRWLWRFQAPCWSRWNWWNGSCLIFVSEIHRRILWFRQLKGMLGEQLPIPWGATGVSSHLVNGFFRKPVMQWHRPQAVSFCPSAGVSRIGLWNLEKFGNH